MIDIVPKLSGSGGRLHCSNNFWATVLFVIIGWNLRKKNAMSIRRGINSSVPPSSLHRNANPVKSHSSKSATVSYSGRTMNLNAQRASTTQVSKHIDEQRLRISELEKESYWMTIETESLKKQIASLDGASEPSKELTKERFEQSKRISKLTDAILSYCSSSIICDTHFPDLQTLKLLDYTPDTDAVLGSMANYSRSAVCTAVVDAPKLGEVITNYIEMYERGLNLLLERPIGSIRVSYVCAHEVDLEGLSLLFTLDVSDQDLLPSRVESYLNGQYDVKHPAVKFMLEATRSLIIDVGVLVDKSAGLRTSPSNARPRPISPTIISHAPSRNPFPPKIYPEGGLRNSKNMPSHIRENDRFGQKKLDTPSEQSVCAEPMPIKPSWGRRASHSGSQSSDAIQSVLEKVSTTPEQSMNTEL